MAVLRKNSVLSVDKNVAAETSNFNKIPQISTSAPHRLETKATGKKHFQRRAGNWVVGSFPALVRNDAGTQIATDTWILVPNGHLAFTLVRDKYAGTANKCGIIEFDTPPGGQIGDLGISPVGMEQIIMADGGDGFLKVSAEQWVLYYRQAICAGCWDY
jgi:hypothetical protein